MMGAFSWFEILSPDTFKIEPVEITAAGYNRRSEMHACIP